MDKDIAFISAGVQQTMFGLMKYVGDKYSLIKTVCNLYTSNFLALPKYIGFSPERAPMDIY